MQKELLTFQLKTAREWVKYHLEDTDEDLMDIVPAGFNNNLYWQYGHVAAMFESELVRLLGKDSTTADAFQKYFGYGTSPDEFDDGTPSMEEVKAVLEQQPAEYEAVTEEKLQEKLEEPFMGMTMSYERAGFTLLHEGLHAGKIQEMKRLLENQY
ncbi:DinB family protein [Lacicoccus alkaliphilus]|uniref:DinB superfamily protein n=1 Tax=Lacicoccus alkaliphilus DSM 16010 TaxID=1123231 RepID=A0A1M7J481_9BACL|nr:DinB family protein [Salinicoccus alkaliphilus]SHM47701.1 DinB superfamily protein [Salinicoccus alkaliphilus DSM 16010]